MKRGMFTRILFLACLMTSSFALNANAHSNIHYAYSCSDVAATYSQAGTGSLPSGCVTSCICSNPTTQVYTDKGPGGVCTITVNNPGSSGTCQDADGFPANLCSCSYQGKTAIGQNVVAASECIAGEIHGAYGLYGCFPGIECTSAVPSGTPVFTKVTDSVNSGAKSQTQAYSISGTFINGDIIAVNIASTTQVFNYSSSDTPATLASRIAAYYNGKSQYTCGGGPTAASASASGNTITITHNSCHGIWGPQLQWRPPVCSSPTPTPTPSPATCPFGQMWNASTNMCECQNGQYMSGATCVSCPGGQTWNGSACTCPANQTWNGTTCNASNPCPTGQTWNSTTNACECPSGSNWNGTSCASCTPPQTWNGSTCACPANQMPNGLNCIACPTGQTSDGLSACQCPVGTTWSGTQCTSCKGTSSYNPGTDKCECPLGQIYNGIACVPACTGGNVWDSSSNGCVCPVGTNSDGISCVACYGTSHWDPSIKKCACAAGETYDGYNCIPCPSGSVWNGSKCACANPLQTWNSSTGACECPSGSRFDGTTCSTCKLPLQGPGCAFDFDQHACSAGGGRIPPSAVSKDVGGADASARFANAVNKKLACCLNSFNTGDYYSKFDCIENSTTRYASFDDLWKSSDPVKDGQQLNAFVLTNSQGRPISGFYTIDGVRCNEFSEFTNDTIQPGKVDPAIMTAQMNRTGSGTGFDSQSKPALEKPSAPEYAKAAAKFNKGAPQTVQDRRRCPILVRSALTVQCPRNPVSTSATTKTYEERDSSNKVIERHCAVASSAQVHVRVEQIWEIAGQPLVTPVDTIVSPKNASSISVEQIIANKSGDQCPPGTVRSGDTCVDQ